MATTAAPALTHLATDDLQPACNAPAAPERRVTDDRERVTCTACSQLPAFRYSFDPKESIWTVYCDSSVCEGRQLETGYYLIADAAEEMASHDCEAEAEAAYDRRYDMGWSNPA